MKPEQIFLNQAGRLRSGWRLLLFVGIYIALIFLIGTLARVLYVFLLYFAPAFQLGDFTENIIFRSTLLASALTAGSICNRWLEGLPWRALGLSLHGPWLRDFLVGSAIGVLSLALAAGIATIIGGLAFTSPNRDMLPPVLKSLFVSAVLFVVAALAEEVLFRGYPLQTMSRARLAWLGVLLTSVPFAAVHLRNPNVVKGFTFINTVLAGIWLAVAYLRTRTLWFPLGVHWAWNWTLGSLVGLPVSGITISSNPLLRGIDLGPAWLTGGSYGLEGGVACTIALLISTIFIWRTRMISASEEMLRLTSQENPAQPNVMISILPAASPELRVK